MRLDKNKSMSPILQKRLIPLQVKPFPEYPGRQLQLYDPGKLLHSAFILQGLVLHSSMSKQNIDLISITKTVHRENNSNRECHRPFIFLKNATELKIECLTLLFLCYL